MHIIIYTTTEEKMSPFNVNRKLLPPRIILYGIQGAGKTTLASKTPSPVFIQLEDGLVDVSVPATDLISRYNDFIGVLDFLLNNEHNHGTVVIDSLDWLERLIHRHVAEQLNVSDISAVPYGRGYDAAAVEWEKIVFKLDSLRRAKNMVVFLLAHSQVRKVELPGQDSYERFQLDLNKRASAILSEWCDCLFFLTYDVSVMRTEGSFGTIKTKAFGDGQRIIYTGERPAYAAKNRYRLPHELKIAEGEPNKFWGELVTLIKANSVNQKVEN